MSEFLSEAAAAIGRNDLAEAERLSLRALGANPNEIDARLILGAVYVRTRRFTEAVSELERVLDSDATSRDALTWITEALRKSGRTEEALSYALKSAELFPTSPEPLFSAAMCLIALSKYSDAEAALRRVLKFSRPPSVLHYMGICLVRLNRPDEAIEYLEEARRAEPMIPNHLVAIGQAKLIGRDHKGAIAFGKKALKLRQNDAGANLLLAQAYSQDGQTIEAEEYIRATLASQPDSAEANGLFGMWLHQMGRFSEAESYLDRALVLDPNQAMPLFFKVQHRKMTSDDLEIVRTIESKTKEENLPVRDLIAMHFALGKAYDDLGDPAIAFSHYDRANELGYEAYGQTDPYSQDRLTHFVDNAIELFTPQNFEKWTPLGHSSDQPIFVLGMIRSGTTLMEQLLSSHPEVAGAGELFYWVDEGFKELDSTLNQLDPDSMSDVTAHYLALLDEKGRGSRFVTDKMPTNHLMLGFIHASLPNAKIVHMLRNPLDICLSIWMTFIQNPPDFTHHKGNIIDACRQHERLRQHWLEVLPPDRYIQVQYEELTRTPETVMRRVLEFCNLEWDEACIHPEKNERFVSTPSLYRVRRPIDASSVSKKDRFGPYLGEFAVLA